MTCKDCIHYELCFDFTHIKSLGDDYIEQHNKQEDVCDHFKNKTDFVKISCRCKNCEHFNNYNPDRTYCEEHSDRWGDSIIYVDEDDYCSFGIRKR